MICPECNGRGETIYYVETYRDENTVTVEQRKGICRTCNGSGEKAQTKADIIRAMTDEELAKWIDDMYLKRLWCDVRKADCNGTECTDCIVRWLQQPCEED